MEELITPNLAGALGDVAADPVAGPNVMAFVIITGLGLAMAVVYVPIRLFLTLTARSRRLKLLQRIRRLREELGQPLES
ncbi:hypothetical protein KQ313_03765 [Synechococcus sp. CS-1325]|uniref:hypothetical protein n=1 Tax=unclassified Synechococcus TaxID=2626047 RepID=UPI000DB45CF7|nr:MULTISPECIES: hypothetical protein [unclassified Synechococcus]PZV00529.1 MAG: hypothetical protein DCF24_06830 [Cyanobium sp.]MCT0198800.1 hypothetical protein [Synechococcus sp. CS-1325]MCT0212859.1 hypothetical protein [Synechococcus sp. CS-1326]MCT0231438.1 hypothetical protein [Synechococcus sp. CS-1324]MCT0233063.1 hypothetical protein [Synechococcus sp. CS-1327]